MQISCNIVNPQKFCRDFNIFIFYSLSASFYTTSLECYIGICVIFSSQLKDIWLIIHHNHIPFWLKTKNAFVHLIAQIIRHFYLQLHKSSTRFLSIKNWFNYLDVGKTWMLKVFLWTFFVDLLHLYFGCVNMQH